MSSTSCLGFGTACGCGAWYHHPIYNRYWQSVNIMKPVFDQILNLEQRLSNESSSTSCSCGRYVSGHTSNVNTNLDERQPTSGRIQRRKNRLPDTINDSQAGSSSCEHDQKIDKEKDLQIRRAKMIQHLKDAKADLEMKNQMRNFREEEKLEENKLVELYGSYAGVIKDKMASMTADFEELRLGVVPWPILPLSDKEFGEF